MFLQLAHLGQELAIRGRLGQSLNEQFHSLNWTQRVEYLAQHPDPGQVFFRNQQLLLTCAGALNIDGREGALVDQLAVENDFHVAGAFEFFKDHVIHARTGVNQGRRDNGQRAAFFDVAG